MSHDCLPFSSLSYVQKSQSNKFTLHCSHFWLQKFSNNSQNESKTSNNPQNCISQSIRPSTVESWCHCNVSMFKSSVDVYFYLDSKHSSLCHHGHPDIHSERSLKGMSLISDAWKLPKKRMTAGGGRLSQLTILLAFLTSEIENFKINTVNKLLQQCELLILNLSWLLMLEKARSFLSR